MCFYFRAKCYIFKAKILPDVLACNELYETCALKHNSPRMKQNDSCLRAKKLRYANKMKQNKIK